MTDRTLQHAVSEVNTGPLTRLWLAAMGVTGFALLTAVGARIAIPLPGTPVPMTLQTLFVLLAGVALGPRLGMLSMSFYLLLGTAGYHVFALGNWGLATVFGATGGYLVGFVLAQPVIGAITQPGEHHWRRVLTAMACGNAIIFACGLTWLSLWMGAGLGGTLEMGLWPFVPGLILKTALATGVGGLIGPGARRWFTR